MLHKVLINTTLNKEEKKTRKLHTVNSKLIPQSTSVYIILFESLKNN